MPDRRSDLSGSQGSDPLQLLLVEAGVVRIDLALGQSDRLAAEAADRFEAVDASGNLAGGDPPNLVGGGTVAACSSSTARAKARQAVLQASAHAGLARTNELQGKVSSAFCHWRELFNGQFPTYG